MSNLQRICAIVAAWQLGACGRLLGIEDLPEPEPDAMAPAPVTYAVKGTAVGLLEPVLLRLEHPGGSELARVDQDGTFAFEARLADGAIYSVTFVDQAPCVLADATGVAEGNIPLVSLACESVLLSGLALSGATAPALDFAPAQRTYQAEVSILQQFVHVTATAASADASVSVHGMPVTSGAPSEPIALALGENHIEIAVANGKGAQRVYRVTVSRAGEIAQYVYGKASNTGAGDNFGASLAIWGDTLAVSTAHNPGLNGPIFPTNSVYVFRRAESSWVQEAHLESSAGGFGHSIALSEDTLAVGVPYPKDFYTGINNVGYVEIYRRSGDSWIEEATIAAPNREANDYFGVSVTLWGDTLAVGATGEDSAVTGVNGEQENNDAPDSGAVYVFRRTSTDWIQEAYLKASNTEPEDKFGSDLSLWNDTLAVAATGEGSSATGVNGDQTDNTAPRSGAVYVFQYSNGAWVQEAYFKASNTTPEFYFGHSVSLWEDTLAVGAAFEASNATGVDGDQTNQDAPHSGAVYVFCREDTTWIQEAYLKASNTDAGDWFGSHVSLWRDTLAVGAPLEDSNATGVDGAQHDDSSTNSGAVYLFHRTGESWAQGAYLKASNTDGQVSGEIFGGDAFGQAVALWEDTLAITAHQEDSSATGLNGTQEDDSAPNSGAVYIFH
jgi:hypothetical protein